MNSRDYWAEREAEALKHYVTDEKEYDARINSIYANMLDGVQKEIDAFYGRYATIEGITISEAKKRVSQLDIAAYERKAKKYVETLNFTDKANEEMRLYNLTMKVNRLEMLKANIGLELIKGHDELEKYMGEILKGRTMEELERQAGILGKTIKNNAKAADAIVNSSFHNAKFSDRIWMYQDLLRADLDKLLQTGLIQGKNPRALTKDLKKYWYGNDPLTGKGQVYCMERLMRTELARVQTEAQKQSFKRNGFGKYEFITNSGCCDICSALDGKHFDVDKMMPGENAPPVHPNCRCSIAAWEDSEEYEAWLDYLANGGTTEEWNSTGKQKWQKSLENSANGDKIKLEISAECQQLIDSLNKRGVESNPVQKHSKKLTEQEIINALAGGDRTNGSCASVGLAYCGQKGGLNVLDFRGEKSQAVFSSKGTLQFISQLPGVKTISETARSSVTAGNRLLKQVAAGKEYYLVSGKHAAIVRKTIDGILQYLELQSATRSGWTEFDENPRYTLKYRFGENKGYDVTDFMIDVDSIKDSDDLRSILGYINTAENEQRKGKNGTIK